MIKYAILTTGILLFVCNSPTQKDTSYYADLSKGTEANVMTDENGIIEAMIEYRAQGKTGQIVIISDSTVFYGLDSSRMGSKDTFPDTLVNALEKMNDKRYYRGNCLLSVSFD